MKNTFMSMQMELSFTPEQSRRTPIPRRRQSRASWWFARMRQAVEHAREWQPSLQPRPEQICLSGIFRQPMPGLGQARRDQALPAGICE